MGSRGIQQEITGRRLPDLLRAIYQGQLLVPPTELPSWEDTRRLKLFEAIYQGLPVGSVSVLRTTAPMEHQDNLGTVPLWEHTSEELGSARDYLVDGIDLITTLFEELGPTFWRNDGTSRRRPMKSRGADRPFLVFDAQTRAFRRKKEGEPVRPTEYPLEDLFDAEKQHAFAARVSHLPDGKKLPNRLAHLVDAFFDFNLPVITIASDDVPSVLGALAIRGTASPPVKRPPQKTFWYCDTCGQPIENPRDGWVEWLVRREEPTRKRVGRGLRLVHHQPASPLPQGCQYDDRREYAYDQSSLRDLSLDDYLGPDGLMLLLELLDRGELPQAQVSELIKRLHLPGYERARFHLPDAIAAGIIEPNLPEGFYWQHQIAAVLDWADKEGRKP